MSVGLATGLQRLRLERAAETLKRGWPEMPAWVFCSEAGTPLDLSNVTEAWRRVLKAAKFPGFRLYDLRHTLRPSCLLRARPLPTSPLSSDTRSRPRRFNGTRIGSRAVTSTGSMPWTPPTRRLVVTNQAVAAGDVVVVIEKLEPTIGLEPMTCRLRTENKGERSDTQSTSDDITRSDFDR